MEVIKKTKLDNTGGEMLLYREDDLYHVYLQNKETRFKLDMLKSEELKVAEHSYNHVLDTNKLIGRSYAKS